MIQPFFDSDDTDQKGSESEVVDPGQASYTDPRIGEGKTEGEQAAK